MPGYDCDRGLHRTSSVYDPDHRRSLARVADDQQPARINQVDANLTVRSRRFPLFVESCGVVRNWRLAAVAYATHILPIKRLIAASIERPEVIHGHFE